MAKSSSSVQFPPIEKHRVVTTLIFIIVACWFLTSSEAVSRWLQWRMYGLIAPVLDQKNDLRMYYEALDAEVKHSSDLQNELNTVRLENARLKVLEKNYRQLEENRNELRELLAFKTVNQRELISAEVVGKSAGHWVKTLQLNAGSNAGIQEGMPVISIDGLVGVVATVHETLSTVRLLTDETCQVSVKVLGTTEYGIASGTRHQFGENGGNLKLQYLPRTRKYVSGMKIVTSGKGAVFPEGVDVGRIESVAYGIDGVEAVVRTGVDFLNLKHLFVVSQ